jgi:hypothetical protein
MSQITSLVETIHLRFRPLDPKFSEQFGHIGLFSLWCSRAMRSSSLHGLHICELSTHVAGLSVWQTTQVLASTAVGSFPNP